MNSLHLSNSSEIFRYSIANFEKNNITLSLGKKYISLDKYREMKKVEVNKAPMNYFLMTKYRSVEENVLFTAKVLYELLDTNKKHVDQLFLEFSNKQGITINLNIERILYLALTFLFSLGKIAINEKMIEKIENEV